MAYWIRYVCLFVVRHDYDYTLSLTEVFQPFQHCVNTHDSLPNFLIVMWLLSLYCIKKNGRFVIGSKTKDFDVPPNTITFQTIKCICKVSLYSIEMIILTNKETINVKYLVFRKVCFYFLLYFHPQTKD